MLIVADENIPYVQDAFAGLGEVRTMAGRNMDREALRDTDILLVRSVTRVGEALLDESKVRFVGTATIGTDHVDQEFLRGKEITFAAAAGSNANSVAEYVCAAMLELARRKDFCLAEKTLGVVGVGNVGSLVAGRAEALGMTVLQNDPPRQRAEGGETFIELDELLARSDIISLHVPLTRTGPDATFHLLDEKRLDQILGSTLLLNTSRGAVVDGKALLSAFPAGIVLDVWENEPNIDTALLAKVDLATPHIAGYSFDGKVKATGMLYEQACQWLGREPTWKWPESLPPPPTPRLEIDASGRTDEDVLRQSVRTIYDVTQDDRALRSIAEEAPSERGAGFDRLRKNYPVRREFHNTRLIVHGGSSVVCDKLCGLGFIPG